MGLHKQVNSRVRLEISLDRLKSNLRKIRERVVPCGVIAVLKANAYGLGVERVAAALAEVGVAGFAAAEPREALQLVGSGRSVQILGGMLGDELPATVAAGIIHPIGCYENAAQISAEAMRQGRTVECHFLVDTGMGRLGILAEEAVETVLRAIKLPGLDCRGIYSHFPVACPREEAYTLAQVQTFKHILATLTNRRVTFDRVHMANSPAINSFPCTTQPPFNLVRTGLDLYGAFDTAGAGSLGLEEVITLKARLVAVRKLSAGMKIGYGLTHCLATDTLVGTVAAGYADGLPLALSNHGHVLIHGRQCAMLGRVSMDYITVSLEDVPDAQCGDEVIILGGDGAMALTVEHWAQLKNTHPYEILCAIGSRVDRCYV